MRGVQGGRAKRGGKRDGGSLSVSCALVPPRVCAPQLFRDQLRVPSACRGGTMKRDRIGLVRLLSRR